MKTSFLLSLAFALVFGEIAPTNAQETKSGLVAAGHDLALKICAQCHVVAKDQDSAPIRQPPAPGFSMIVARPDMTEASLRSFLAAPHGDLRRNSNMPGFLLADFQIKQLIAYLFSLKGNQNLPN